MNRYTDSKGIGFNHYREHLPKRASDFPRRRAIRDRDVMTAFHQQWHCCFVTGVKRGGFGVKLEAHHLFEGTAGRSDELCNLIMLDRQVHEQVKTTTVPLGLLLWCKWHHDRPNTDWVRMTVLRGSFLPDLIHDPKVLAVWRKNQGILMPPLPVIKGGA